VGGQKKNVPATVTQLEIADPVRRVPEIDGEFRAR